MASGTKRPHRSNCSVPPHPLACSWCLHAGASQGRRAMGELADGLDLTTPEASRTAAGLGKQRSAVEGSNQTPGCPCSWLEKGVRKKNPQGQADSSSNISSLRSALWFHVCNPSTGEVD